MGMIAMVKMKRSDLKEGCADLADLYNPYDSDL